MPPLASFEDSLVGPLQTPTGVEGTGALFHVELGLQFRMGTQFRLRFCRLKPSSVSLDCLHAGQRDRQKGHEMTTLEAMLDGAPVVLPWELTLTLKPGYGPYCTCDGEGPGVTLTVQRGTEKASHHYPNRYQAWARVSAMMGRVAS
jgi:hypothetical protein